MTTMTTTTTTMTTGIKKEQEKKIPSDFDPKLVGAIGKENSSMMTKMKRKKKEDKMERKRKKKTRTRMKKASLARPKLKETGSFSSEDGRPHKTSINSFAFSRYTDWEKKALRDCLGGCDLDWSVGALGFLQKHFFRCVFSIFTLFF